MKALLLGIVILYHHHSTVTTTSRRRPSHKSALSASTSSSLESDSNTKVILSSSVSTSNTHAAATAITETTTSSSSSQQHQQQHQQHYDSLYLVSLPAPPDETAAAASSFLLSSLLISSLWKWKDRVLGDGHDFFVPRSKTLVALNHVLAEQLQLQLQLQQPDGGGGGCQPSSCKKSPSCQVTVLSNCARYDVIVATTTTTTTVVSAAVAATTDVNHDHHQQWGESSVRLSLARSLLHQVERTKEVAANRLTIRNSLDLIMSGGDQPSRIFCPPHPNELAPIQSDSNLLLVAESFVVLQGPESVARYLCHVAAGLQPPNRRWRGRKGGDETEVARFRPFSSRDAHIILQLKRTADITTGSSSSSSSGSARQGDGSVSAFVATSSAAAKKRKNSLSRVGVLRDLLNCALSAGKSCRNVRVVPAIAALRPYGGGGTSSRYGNVVGGGEPPLELSQRAIQQARELAIEPMVRAYCNKWRAYEAANQVVALRKAVQDYLQETTPNHHADNIIDEPLVAAPAAVRELMHQAMMDLRQGKSVNMQQILEQVAQLMMKIDQEP